MATNKPTQSMASFVDSLLFSGTTWDNLKTRVERESKRRELKTPYHVRTHITYRKKVLGWTFEEDDVGIRGLPPTKPEKAKAEKKPAAKAKPKNGQPTGRKTRAVKQENGRQTVTEQPAPAPEPKTEKAA